MTKTAHLYNIDFVKGIASISVILLHTLPRSVLMDSFAVFHIWQAVPFFIFISFYLGFRHFEQKGILFKGYYSKNRFIRLFNRVWLPLIILAIIETIFFAVLGNYNKAIGCLLCYDNGPGSYYVWCYTQIWFIMPAIYLLMKRSGIVVGGGYFIDTWSDA
jgi:peptidoglycan/LPS O-acetylase OafA/YrhL